MPVAAAPVSYVFFEGYDASAGSSSGSSSGGGTVSGLENLNRRIRDSFQGQNYFSRLFQWNQIEEAVNFVTNLAQSSIYAVGYSRGGNSVAQFASQLGTRAVNKMVMLDPVRCGSNDIVAGCATDLDVEGQSPVTVQFAWPPISFQNPEAEYTINSVGDITVPSNVQAADSYFQRVTEVERATPLSNAGDRIQGDDSVENAQNIDAEAVLGPQVTHTNIDDNALIQQRLVDEMRSQLDDERLFTGLGGSSGFGTLAMTRNDDGSSTRIDLPFALDFGGAERTSLFINNNGNITFDGPEFSYTPTGFAGLQNAMIAPFWADVDTRCSICGEVYVAAPASDTFVVTWDGVGFYNQNADKLNTFQLVLRDRYDLTGDVVDIEFRYEDISWTTGDASGGENGLGGTPAFAGFTGDTNTAPQQLSGSGTGSIIDLDNRSNLGDSGVFAYQIRDSAAPGTSLDNPLLPDVIDGTWNFQYETTAVEEIVWSDPEVAIGYDYQALAGALFRSFILPDGIGDSIYSLELFSGAELVQISDTLMAGNEYLFSDFGIVGGTDFFRIGDIEVGAAIDPTNTTAFVTGLSFLTPGIQRWTQAPIVVNTDVNVAPIPLPASGFLLLGALLGIAANVRATTPRRRSPA